MADPKNRERLARHREARRASGLKETNIWMPEAIQAAIDREVANGAYPSRRAAIIHALERFFTEPEMQR